MENSGISMKTTTLLIFFLLALAGCSSTSSSERTDYKNEAAKARPLDMPPDLVLPKTDDKYVVPDGSGETVAIYSEYAKSSVAQNPACVCKDAVAAQPDGAQTKVQQQPAAAVVAPPRLQDHPDGSKSILIGESFDRCWLKVSQSLDLAGIAVEDKDRSKGLLYLKGGHNQLSVQARASELGGAGQEGAAGCEVAASNGSGAANDETKRIIDALYKNLSK